MKDFQQQGAQPLPSHSQFFQKTDTPKEQTKDLVSKILSFIEDIDAVTFQPALADQLQFLDKLASDVVSLHQLTLLSTSFSESVTDCRKIVNNILNCKVFLPKFHIEISALDAAKDYRKSKKNKEVLSLICKGFNKDQQHTLILSQELRLLTHDLNAEMENI